MGSHRNRENLGRITLLVVGVFMWVACGPAQPPPPIVKPPPPGPSCPSDMVRIDAQVPYCIDRYEAAVVEIGPDGERPHSPFTPVTNLTVRAISREGLVPQGYISGEEALAACKRSEKRLCSESEWVRACSGKEDHTYPYGNERRPGACNDHGRSPLVLYKGMLARNPWDAMNDARLNQAPNTVAKSGAHPECKSSDGVFDMMGNLHEWLADRDGTFVGGYFLDTKLNGDGCHYKTTAHAFSYHDYSNGFRCCKDL